MNKVTVLSAEPKHITWGAKPGREAGGMRVQEVWIYTVGRDDKPSPFPEKIELILDRASESRPEQPPYAVGDYTLHPSAIYVGRSGRLEVSPRLTAVAKRA